MSRDLAHGVLLFFFLLLSVLDSIFILPCLLYGWRETERCDVYTLNTWLGLYVGLGLLPISKNHTELFSDVIRFILVP